MMAATEKGSTPAKDEIEVAATNDGAHTEAPNAAPEACAQGAAAANTGLASRPRRSLRSVGRAVEDSIAKKTVKIITKRPQRKWDAERLITDPKSPLAKANLRVRPTRWHILTLIFPDQFLETDDLIKPISMEQS